MYIFLLYIYFEIYHEKILIYCANYHKNINTNYLLCKESNKILILTTYCANHNNNKKLKKTFILIHFLVTQN